MHIVFDDSHLRYRVRGRATAARCDLVWHFRVFYIQFSGRLHWDCVIRSRTIAAGDNCRFNGQHPIPHHGHHINDLRGE